MKFVGRVDRGLNIRGSVYYGMSVLASNRYARLAPDYLSDFVGRLSRPRTVGGTNLIHDRGGNEVRER